MNRVAPNRLTLWGLSLASIVVIFIIWHVATTLGAVKSFFLPSPARTMQALWQLLSTGKFFHALIASMLRIVTATVLAVVVGAAIGIATGLSQRAEYLLNPVTQPLHYVPLSAIIPLLVLWFGIGEEMKITFLFIAVLSYFIPLVHSAIARVPEHYINVARSFGASKTAILQKIYLPQALPRMFEGLLVVNAIGWNYIILAEIINAKNGLGYMINIAGRLGRSDEVFAGLILISAVAMISHYILQAIAEKYFFW